MQNPFLNPQKSYLIPDPSTFVILANSDGLSRWRGLGDDADVLAAPAALLFLQWLL